MPESSEVIAIRQLPDGTAFQARITARDRDRLVIQSTPGLQSNASSQSNGRAEPFLQVGALVEVTDANALYLGEVIECKEGVLTVAIEHFIDRAALADLDRIWTAGESDKCT